MPAGCRLMTRSVYPAKPSSRKAMTKEAMMETRNVERSMPITRTPAESPPSRPLIRLEKPENVLMIICTANRITM